MRRRLPLTSASALLVGLALLAATTTTKRPPAQAADGITRGTTYRDAPDSRYLSSAATGSFVSTLPASA